MWSFPTPRKCDRCGETFTGQGFVCPACRAKAKRRRYYATRGGRRRGASLTPAQEAYQQGDAELYRAGLRGELD